MARKYTPAWQRTLLTALNNAPNASDGQSAWDSLPPEEQSAVKRFLADRAKGDQDKAFEKFEEFRKSFGKYEFEIERYFDHGLAFTSNRLDIKRPAKVMVMGQ